MGCSTGGTSTAPSLLSPNGIKDERAPMRGIHNSIGSDRPRLQVAVAVIVTVLATALVTVVLGGGGCSGGATQAAGSAMENTASPTRITTTTYTSR